MNEQQERALVDGLRALAATTRDAGASPRVERAVRAALTRTRPAAPRRTGRFGYAAAAALVVVSISGVWFARESTQHTAGPIHPAGFVEIPGAWTLPPMESGSIVRVALPVTVLPQYGLAIVPDIASNVIEAELLVAQDGLARMIRLVVDEPTRSTP